MLAATPSYCEFPTGSKVVRMPKAGLSRRRWALKSLTGRSPASCAAVGCEKKVGTKLVSLTGGTPGLSQSWTGRWRERVPR
jgi:hypothetical protein